MREKVKNNLLCIIYHVIIIVIVDLSPIFEKSAQKNEDFLDLFRVQLVISLSFVIIP